MFQRGIHHMRVNLESLVIQHVYSGYVAHQIRVES